MPKFRLGGYQRVAVKPSVLKQPKFTKETRNGTNKDLKKFQQAANRVQSHPKWEEALEELDTKPGARNEAKANAKGYFKGKGVPVPDEMDVTFIEGSTIIKLCGWGVCITIEW